MNPEKRTEKQNIIKKSFQKFSEVFRQEKHAIFMIFFLANLSLVFYFFFPRLNEINFWDEAIYVNRGMSLLQGNFPLFTDNPFLAFVYGLLSLPVLQSPYWMILACGAGRFLMYVFLWVAVYLIARELDDVLDVPVVLGLMFVSSVIIDILPNPSDGMFTVLSAFTFWKLLRFYRRNQPGDLIWSSIFLGLAALSRNDGIVLYLIYLVLVLMIILIEKRKIRYSVNAVLPFLLILGGYMLISGLMTGNYSMGVSARSYLAFEQGHELVFEGDGIHSPTINAMLGAREVYGTPEENDLSVFKAIINHPDAYFQRLKVIVNKLPFQILEVYNKKMTLLIFLFMFRGLFELIRKRKVVIASLIVFWSAYLLTYFMTFFREGYLRTVFFIIFLLAAVGISAISKNLTKRSERIFLFTSLGSLIVAGLVFNKLAIYYGAVVVLAAFLAIIALHKQFDGKNAVVSQSLVLLLVAGVILRGNYPSPRLWQLGDEGDEMAAHYMYENLEPGTSVLAGSPGVPWLARMNFLSLNSTDVPAMESTAIFYDWMKNEGIEAVYVDYSISRDAQYYWDLIQAMEGDGLELVFSADQGSNRVYLVDTEWSQP